MDQGEYAFNVPEFDKLEKIVDQVVRNALGKSVHTLVAEISSQVTEEIKLATWGVFVEDFVDAKIREERKAATTLSDPNGTTPTSSPPPTVHEPPEPGQAVRDFAAHRRLKDRWFRINNEVRRFGSFTQEEVEKKAHIMKKNSDTYATRARGFYGVLERMVEWDAETVDDVPDEEVERHASDIGIDNGE